MLAQLVNRDFVNECVGLAAVELNRSIGGRRRRGGAPGPLDEFSTEELQDVFEHLQASAVPLEEGGPVEGVPPKDDFMYMPRDPMASIVQSVIDEHVARHEPDEVLEEPAGDDRRAGGLPLLTGERLRDVPLAAHTEGRRLWRPFEVARPKILSDPGWLVSGVVIAWHSFKRKADFREPGEPIALADDARILLVGDWGSGIPRAQKVADCMRAELDEGRTANREQHVIHLGDVYYTGGKREYEERFLAHWPVDKPDDAKSYALMGNHDMYRGGHAFFDTCLADSRFTSQQGSSVFALVGNHWQFLALDSAYEDKGLFGGQADWVGAQLPAAGADADDRKRTVLLSHHQLYSAYEPGANEMGDRLAPALASGSVDAWFWAHEHRCLAYGRDRGLSFASCVGHGGIPEYLIATGEEPLPPPLEYDYRRVEGDGDPPWNTFGFAVVELEGRGLQVRYIDEYGTEHHQAQIE